MVNLCFVILCFSTLVFCIKAKNKEDLAQQLLDSRVYRGVKTIDDARFVTDTLAAAYQTDRVRPEQRMSTEQTFTCSSTGRSNPRPTNARKLLPGDIDLIIGMGDSITAGFGADAITLFTLFIEYRATSFSIGSNRGVDTLPNSLVTMNYNLTGYAIGSGPAESDQARLNVAKSGAVSSELLPQVDLLISKLSGTDPNLWKHITIFIGGNDLCDSCQDPDSYTPEQFQANIEAVLDELKARLQNVFVSLVSPPDVTVLKDVNNKYLGGLLPLCSLIREFVCPCAYESSTSQLQDEYVNVLHEIETMPKYNNTDTFYVSVQPFLENVNLPKLPNGDVDTTYFAPDCFHWSRKSHSEAGLALWNNMMEPRGAKRTDWDIYVPFKCPAAGQYLQ